MALFIEQARACIARVGLWTRHHSAEIVLAALFALPFAYVVAAYIEHPDPFTIYIVADSDTNKETLDTFREKEKIYPIARIGDVDVQVKLIILPDTAVETAQRVAHELINRPDTLMVVGSGRSQLVEKSLPIYFTAHPRVPYVATTATDDDLLKDCGAECFQNGVLHPLFGPPQFAPLLQLAPTNLIQASSAVEFAIENGKRRFLIVSGNDSQNHSYAENLSNEYEAAIQEAAREGAVEVNKYDIDRLPEDDKKLADLNPECVLYVGNFGEAQTLFKRLQHISSVANHTMMILSDSVIQTRTSDAQLSQVFRQPATNEVIPVRFTHQTVASDYNDHVSTYDRDAVTIGQTLISDLNERGIDLRMRVKTWFHIHRAADARRNLNRIMRENAAVRTWYEGDSPQGRHPVTYIFRGHNQFNGIFHVWRLQDHDAVGMEDVDHWHPGRGITFAQESASFAAKN
jgi:hypothetical protein